MSTKEDKNNYEELLKKLILSYELHKNQNYVDRLIKEGELKGYKDILNSYNKGKELGKIIDEEIIDLVKFNIYKSKEEYIILKAQENIFNTMSKELEDNLSTLDIQNIMRENNSNNKYPKDIEIRIKNKKCALKRPGTGKNGFSCEEEIVKGSKYCKEHNYKYNKVWILDNE